MTRINSIISKEVQNKININAQALNDFSGTISNALVEATTIQLSMDKLSFNDFHSEVYLDQISPELKATIKSFSKKISNNLISGIDGKLNYSEISAAVGSLSGFVNEKNAYYGSSVNSDQKDDVVSVTDELNELINEKLENSPSNEQLFSDVINSIVVKIKESEWSSKAKNIATQVVISVVASLIATTILTTIDNSNNTVVATDKDKILIVKQVMNDTRVPDVYKRTHRYVSKDNLYVRSYSKKQSNIVDVLHIGNVVKVVNKKRNWTLVEFKNGDGDSERGWVNTRYIEKIK